MNRRHPNRSASGRWLRLAALAFACSIVVLVPFVRSDSAAVASQAGRVDSVDVLPGDSESVPARPTIGPELQPQDAVVRKVEPMARPPVTRAAWQAQAHAIQRDLLAALVRGEDKAVERARLRAIELAARQRRR